MKKWILLILVYALLLSGCSGVSDKTDTEPMAPETITAPETKREEVSADTSVRLEETQTATVVSPLFDPILENLDDGIFSVSLDAEDVYLDDTGKLQMHVRIYNYDKYDMVDISMLKVGDILLTHSGEVKVNSLNSREDGSILINGGLDENGIDLATDNNGIFFESGYNDAKNWYQVGEATIRVCVDFVYHDASDLELGEILYYPGSFLVGEVTNYDFTPHNTTIRVENGQIVEMHRIYVP